MMCGLFHNAIRATDLDTTREFYTRFLDMQVDQTRPPLEVVGYWLRSSLPDSVATLHVFGERFAEVNGRIPTGSAAIHHSAMYCKGYEVMRQKLKDYGLNWTGLAVPGQRQWQIFVYDPNGILLELTFDAAAEAIPTPEIPAANTFTGEFDYFEPAQFTQFAQFAR